MAARNTKYLAKKPASGGMPASENISAVRITAMKGVGLRETGEIADILDMLAIRATHGQDAGEGAERHDHVESSYRG